MDNPNSFMITNNMRVEFRNIHLNTEIVIYVDSPTGSRSISMGVTGWTQFKKSILDIDTEFYRRFNYQYPDFYRNPYK